MRSLCLTKREQKGHTVQATSEGKAASLPEFRLFRPDNPYLALGLAVVHLIKMPAFANLRFGDWSQILVGQINRKHYYFVVDSKNKIQGFFGLGDYYERQGRGLDPRPRRIVREWHRRRLHRSECVGGKHTQGEQLSGQGGAQDLQREGALFQALLQGRQRPARPPAPSHQTESCGRGMIPVEHATRPAGGSRWMAK